MNNLITLIVSFAMFMEAVDTTIINTAIPVMAESLNVYPINLKLALISYLLSLATFIPISGWIADKFGLKKVFITAILIFTLSSIWCGFTQNLLELVLARLMQGLGGSLCMPLGRLIILRSYQRHELIAKMNIVVMVASLGLMLGPFLGGIITEQFSWPWIFWVNIPFGFGNALLAYYLLPTMPPRPVKPLDKSGFLLFGLGLAMLTFSLSMFSERGLSLIYPVFLLAVSILLLLAYLRHSMRISNPVVKVSLFAIRTFRISAISNLLTRLSFGGIPFLLPLLFQIILDYSPRLSGLMLVPVALGVMIVKSMSTFFLRLLGYKRLLIINTLLVSCSLYSLALINRHSTVWSISILTFIYGFLIALQYSGMNSLAYANIEEEDISAATSVVSTNQQIAQSFGVAISAILLSIFSYQHSIGHQLSLSSFHSTFLCLGLMTSLSCLIFFKLEERDGEELLHPSALSQTTPK